MLKPCFSKIADISLDTILKRHQGYFSRNAASFFDIFFNRTPLNVAKGLYLFTKPNHCFRMYQQGQLPKCNQKDRDCFENTGKTPFKA